MLYPVNAGESKVVQGIGAAMLSGNDMLNVQCCERCIVPMQLAVCTAITSTLPHQGPGRLVHRLG
jgi:hypothetical protein